jgi:8-oxo-dGTP pyrophosphatase MutT (NUDIX family)
VRISKETPMQAAIRGLHEELGFSVSRVQLKPLSRGTPDLHESSAYTGLWSETIVYRFDLDLPDLPWPERVKVFDDNGTSITIERVRY